MDAKYLTALKEKADAGDVAAMLEYGQSLGRENPESIVWLEKAAAAGSPKALTSLGWAWEKGFHGATVDVVKAADYYTRAVAAGQTQLGPIDLVAHAKKLATKAKKLANSGPPDPIAEAFAETKLDKHKDAVLGARRPSLRWVATARADDPTEGSKLGGSPDLPAGTAWPTGAGRGLEHVATLDFDAAPAIDGIPRIEGKLLFFYDAKNQAFGKDAVGDGAFAIVHVPRGAKTTRQSAPAGTKTFAASALAPTLEQTLPSVTSHAWAGMKLGSKPVDKYRDLLERWPQATKHLERHRSFGHGDVTNDSDGPEPELLFQLDSYGHGSVNWGDAGRLFWWIDAADLAAGRFDAARLELHG